MRNRDIRPLSTESELGLVESQKVDINVVRQLLSFVETLRTLEYGGNK